MPVLLTDPPSCLPPAGPGVQHALLEVERHGLGSEEACGETPGYTERVPAHPQPSRQAQGASLASRTNPDALGAPSSPAPIRWDTQAQVWGAPKGAPFEESVLKARPQPRLAVWPRANSLASLNLTLLACILSHAGRDGQKKKKKKEKSRKHVGPPGRSGEPRSAGPQQAAPFCEPALCPAGLSRGTAPAPPTPPRSDPSLAPFPR